MTQPVEDASIETARNRIATLALSMYQPHGFPAPGPDELGGIVKRAEAVMSLNQLRHPDSISASAIGQIDQFVISAAEAKRRPVNIYGADAARPDQAGGGAIGNAGKAGDMLERLRASAAGGRLREEVAAATGSDRASGARFDDLGSLDWGSPAGLAKMRDYAVQKGIPWAANNPELLRLGPAAVGALAEVHLKQETYKTLTTDASFKAKDVVTLARFAKEENVEANALGRSVATVERGLTPEEKAKFNGPVLSYMADRKNPEKQKKAAEAFDTVDKAHPEKHKDLQALREQVKLSGEKLDRAKDAQAQANTLTRETNAKSDAKDARAGTEAIRTEGKQTQANANLDMLGAALGTSPPPAPKGEASKQDSAHKTPLAPVTPQKPASVKIAAAAPKP